MFFLPSAALRHQVDFKHLWMFTLAFVVDTKHRHTPRCRSPVLFPSSMLDPVALGSRWCWWSAALQLKSRPACLKTEKKQLHKLLLAQTYSALRNQANRNKVISSNLHKRFKWQRYATECFVKLQRFYIFTPSSTSRYKNIQNTEIAHSKPSDRRSFFSL